MNDKLESLYDDLVERVIKYHDLRESEYYALLEPVSTDATFSIQQFAENVEKQLGIPVWFHDQVRAQDGHTILGRTNGEEIVISMEVRDENENDELQTLIHETAHIALGHHGSRREPIQKMVMNSALARIKELLAEKKITTIEEVGKVMKRWAGGFFECIIESEAQLVTQLVCDYYGLANNDYLSISRRDTPKWFMQEAKPVIIRAARNIIELIEGGEK